MNLGTNVFRVCGSTVPIFAWKKKINEKVVGYCRNHTGYFSNKNVNHYHRTCVFVSLFHINLVTVIASVNSMVLYGIMIIN